VKNKTIAAFVLAYVLLGSVYSVTPTFADNHITIIESTLNDFKEDVEDKFDKFNDNGLEIPSTALSSYENGLVKYQETLNFLGETPPDFVNADTSGRQALTFFGDAYQILKAEEDLVVEPEGYVGDILAITESITALEDEYTRISALIDINDLSIIDLDELSGLITSANTNFADENYAEALAVIESAEAVLNEILKQIEYKAEEEQAERVSKYVEDLVGDLEDLISSASDAGLDPSVISQFEDLVKLLNNYESPSDVFDLTSESSDHKEALDDADENTYKGKIETELVNDTGEEGGEAEFKQRGERTELKVEIEGQAPGVEFTVSLNGDAVVGSEFTTDEDGDGKLKLKSKDCTCLPFLIDDTTDKIIDSGLIQILDGSNPVLSGTFSFDGDDTEEVEEEEIEIEVEVEGGSAEVKVKFGDQVFEFVVDEIDETAIAFAIENNQDLLDAGFILTASEIINIWELEVEDYEGTEEGVDDADEIELKGFLRDNENGTFDLTNEDQTETIASAIVVVDGETEIDDDLSLSELNGLEVEVDAIEIDGVLVATEIEVEDYEGTDEGTEEGTDEGTEEGTDEGTEEGTDEGTDDGSDNSGSSSEDDGSDNSGSFRR